MTRASSPTLRSRPLTLVYNIPTKKTQQFWEGIKEGKIYTTRCRKCNRLSFPPVADCPTCFSSNMDWIELRNEGEIETFTHIPIKPTSFQAYDDYTIAIARLKEGVRVLAWLAGVGSTDVKIGMKVKLVAKITLENMLSYEFVPV